LLASLLHQTHKVNRTNNSNFPTATTTIVNIPESFTPPRSNFGRDSQFGAHFDVHNNNNNINKLGETVISEYVSEDGHC